LSAPAPPGPAAYLPARRPPLLYLGFAHLCLASAFALAAWRPAEIAGFYYHPRLIALVHLVTLGWIGSSILGALYLVGPLTFRITLPASRADTIAFLGWAIAVAGVAAHFWLATLAGVAWAGILAVAAMAFVGARVLLRLPSAPVPIEARLPVMLALANMLLAAGLGILLGFNKTSPFLPVAQLDAVIAHAHLAAIGFATLMVMGAGYRLLPMMLPSAPPRGGGPLLATALTDAGAWLLAGGRLLGSPRTSAAGAVLAASGIVAFLGQVAWMLRHRRPAPTAQPRPDPGVAHALAALAWLAAAVPLGLWLALAPPSERALAGAMAYGVIGLVGFLAQMVVGVSARLLPLAGWLWGFYDREHRENPPSPHTALSRRAQMAGLALWTLGVPALALGLADDRLAWVSGGAGALALAVVLDAVNLAMGLRRLSERGRG
jgi:hypothetical protein